MIMDHKLPYA